MERKRIWDVRERSLNIVSTRGVCKEEIREVRGVVLGIVSVLSKRLADKRKYDKRVRPIWELESWFGIHGWRFVPGCMERREESM
jgi:hypothetical protein